MSDNSQIILYQTQDGETRIEVKLENETVWLTLDQMANLFQRNKSVISRHIKNIYESGELLEEGTVTQIATVQREGTRDVKRDLEFYNLDMIISVGYRVNSHRGVQFRIWATTTLREYLVKGFVIDDDRLSGKRGNYFEELLERVRKIRTSEVNFYEKVKAVFSTSIDYQIGSDVAKQFYAVVQNKFHYAITGSTAAEIIVNRINASKPDMGLTHKKGEKITRHEAEVAKNYLGEVELKRLELLVEQFLSFAELQSVEQRPMYMADWLRKLDEFIVFNEKKVLNHAGKVSHEDMRAIVKEEYEKYRTIRETQDGLTKKEIEALYGKADQRYLPPPADDEEDE